MRFSTKYIMDLIVEGIQEHHARNIQVSEVYLTESEMRQFKRELDERCVPYGTGPEGMKFMGITIRAEKSGYSFSSIRPWREYTHTPRW